MRATDAAPPDAVEVERIVVDADPVLLTRDLQAALAAAVRGGRRPVVVTGSTARVSYPAALLLRQAGGEWRRGHPEGPDEFATAPAEQRDTEADERTAAFELSVAVEQRADAATRLGRVVESFLGSDARWGSAEPVELPWERDRFTAESRRVVASAPPFVIRSTTGSSVVRTFRSRHGVTEHTRLLLLGGDLDAVTETVRGLAGSLRHVGHALVRRRDASPDGHLLDGAAAPLPELALLGPRLVRALRADASTGVPEGAEAIGVARAPSLLLPLRTGDGTLRTDLVRSVVALIDAVADR